MLPAKLFAAVNELLNLTVPCYAAEQTPPFDQIQNPNGFVSWDIDSSTTLQHTEGFAYGNDSLIIEFELTLIVYADRVSKRSVIQTQIMDILQPIVSGKRTHLRGRQLVNAFVRKMYYVSTSEFAMQKTGQSMPELTAAIMLFNCSFSITE